MSALLADCWHTVWNVMSLFWQSESRQLTTPTFHGVPRCSLGVKLSDTHLVAMVMRHWPWRLLLRRHKKHFDYILRKSTFIHVLWVVKTAFIATL